MTEEQGMKILFLDIDGVLNNMSTVIQASRNRKKRHKEESLDKTGIDYAYRKDLLDSDLVARLQFIKDKTNCMLVLSSTWRRHYIRAEMEMFLQAKGYPGIILGYTPKSTTNVSRGSEIQEWLNDQP